ncbi:MAG: hypothetical protein H0X42_05645, partial [Solirubrobacterales bacterium]|nr:hypothetical protein [Solirubrobacterales bacterium]
MSGRGNVVCVALIAAVVAALTLGAPLALAAAGDPTFVFFAPRTGEKPAPQVPPPGTGFEGPCGLAVSPAGTKLFVSDYYHHAVDVFSLNNPPDYQRQLAKEDPLDGPCQLAFDSSERLYVNNYHRNVIRFSATGLEPEAVLDEAHPTGVAVDILSDTVYVDDGTYIAAYDSSGNPILEGGEPLKIGLGNLEEGYGAAAVAGRLYVADAASNTVKVFEPAVDVESPVATITGPGLGFSSLRDAAVAVDATTRKLYVVDNLQPGVAEEPEAVVDVFSSANAYLGKLKYRIVDAGPVGLTSYGGSPYVTSGNTSQASVYGYPPNSEVATSLPPMFSLAVASAGAGSGAVHSAATFGVDCSGTCEEPIRSGATVTLTATPDPGSAFAGWSGGGCAGSAACTVTMDGMKSVTAVFAAAAPFTAGAPADQRST